MPNSNFMSDANATAIFTAYASAIKLGLKAWVGTTAEWDQLTDDQKKQYQVNFKTDDCSGESIEAVKQSIADDFSINVNYNKGEYCYHLGNLYKFTSAHTAGAWSAADAEQVQVGDELGELKNTLATKGQLDWSQAVDVTLPYTPTKTGQLIISGVAIGAEGTLSISDYTASLILFITQVAHQNTGLGGSVMVVSGHEYRMITFNAQIDKMVFVPVI